MIRRVREESATAVSTPDQARAKAKPHLIIAPQLRAVFPPIASGSWMPVMAGISALRTL
jgi:hypothetical protein